MEVPIEQSIQLINSTRQRTNRSNPRRLQQAPGGHEQTFCSMPGGPKWLQEEADQASFQFQKARRDCSRMRANFMFNPGRLQHDKALEFVQGEVHEQTLRSISGGSRKLYKEIDKPLFNSIRLHGDPGGNEVTLFKKSATVQIFPLINSARNQTKRTNPMFNSRKFMYHSKRKLTKVVFNSRRLHEVPRGSEEQTNKPYIEFQEAPP